MAAAETHTISGSRFLRPRLSRFFNQVAQLRRRISRFVGGAASLLPPLPTFMSSRFAGPRPSRFLGSRPSPSEKYRSLPGPPKPGGFFR